MSILKNYGARVAALVVSGLSVVGCHSDTTNIEFTAPTGSSMVLMGKQYKLPAVVTLKRPSGIGVADRSDIEFALQQKGELVLAHGVIDVLGYEENDVDRYSTNTCTITDGQVSKIAEGYAITFHGISASTHPIYNITIGKKHEAGAQ